MSADKKSSIAATCKSDLWFRGKFYRKGETVEVSPDVARAAAQPGTPEAAQFDTPDTLRATREREAAELAQQKVNADDFMARARASGELRRKAELARAMVAEDQAKKQVDLARQARQTLAAER